MKRRSGSVIPRGVPFAQIPHAMTLDLEVTCVAHRVYALLMKLANSESRAWPGHRYLEKHLPLTRKTIAGGISNLEDTGWLIVDRSRQGHRYTIVVELARLDLDYSNRSSNDSGVDITPAELVPRSGVELTPEPESKLPRTDNHDRQPETENVAPRNIAFEFLTGDDGFGLPAKTTTQKRRVGRLARELNASIDLWLEATARRPSDVERELRDRAAMWPDHFDVVMTADAFVKHFELLGAPPLKRSKSATTRDKARAAMDALEAEEPNADGRIRV